MARLTLAALVLAPLLLAQGKEADALKALEIAFKGSNEHDQEAAIQLAVGVENPDVIKLVAKGLRERSYAVREAAIKCLGRTRHPDALKALHSLYWRDKTLSKRSEHLFALLLTEIARHGDKRSIKVLGDHSYKNLTLASGRARILGAANIRHRDAIDRLIKASKKFGGTKGPGDNFMSEWQSRYREYIVASLTILTGHNIGSNFAVWHKWWSSAKKDYRVAPDRPGNIPEEYKKLWEEQYGEPYGGPDDKQVAEKALGSPYHPIAEPTREQVDAALKGLKKAFKERAPEPRVVAIQVYAGVIDRQVILQIAKGLSDKNPSVRGAAIDALGWSKHKDALRQLHRFYRRHISSLSKEEPELFGLLLKSIGRHGDKSSLRVLEDSPLKNLTLASGTARILGVANIRETDSLRRLMKWMQMGGGGSRRTRVSTDPQFNEQFRLAAAVLTGEDLGLLQEAWLKWWRDAKKKGFKVTAARPKLSGELKASWEKYWKETY